METWKQVDKLTYEVSDLGRIRSTKTNRMLSPFDRSSYGPHPLRGYLTVHLCNGSGKYKNRTVHSIVMETFIGPRPDGFVINHKNGIRGDNRLSNLEYCTQSYNRKQDFKLGRQSLRGEKNTQCILKEKQVLKILEMHKKGSSYLYLANKYKVSISAIRNIFNGHTWSYLTGIKNV